MHLDDGVTIWVLVSYELYKNNSVYLDTENTDIDKVLESEPL